MQIHISAKKKYAVLLCLLPCTSLFAGPSADSLSLQQAVALTLAHYPAVKAKEAMVKAGEAAVTDAKHNWYPAVRLHEQVDAGTDNSIYGSYFTMGMIPSTSGGIRAENNSALMSGNIAMANMQWEIFNFGAYGSQRNAARQELQVNRTDLANTTNQITATVIRSYLELLRLRALQQIQADNINRTNEVLRAVTALVLHGLRPGVDSAVAAAELSKARLNLIGVCNSYNQVRIELGAFTGLDTTQVNPQYDSNTQLQELLSPDTTAATTEHPVLQYFKAQFLRQQSLAAVIRKQNRPRLNLMAAGWMRGSSGLFNDVYDKNLFSGLGYSRYNYLLGLGITWNLTDVKRTHEKVAIQQYKSAAAEQELENSRIALRSLHDQAQADILTVKDKLRELPMQLKAAQAAANQKISLYKHGLTGIIEVTNALFVLNRAETDMVQARDEAWKALFRAAYADNSLNRLLTAFSL
ncbi:TolC family protein [Chitinophaga solisilvae]|uniref:TolC family protein n=1 Tax=Chitinophaga solisilvae TaxID=1233460 RepID=UPI00136D6563|nr:TolC family protein [Chitinophaga solisilvae]